MKLKKLKSIGHNTAASYMSTLSHIGTNYTSTALYRFCLERGLTNLELDVINNKISHFEHLDIENSLRDLKEQFKGLLTKENIPFEAIKEFKMIFIPNGPRRDVIDFSCLPVLVDLNDKKHVCTPVSDKYPESV